MHTGNLACTGQQLIPDPRLSQRHNGGTWIWDQMQLATATGWAIFMVEVGPVKTANKSSRRAPHSVATDP